MFIENSILEKWKEFKPQAFTGCLDQYDDSMG